MMQNQSRPPRKPYYGYTIERRPDHYSIKYNLGALGFAHFVLWLVVGTVFWLWALLEFNGKAGFKEGADYVAFVGICLLSGAVTSFVIVITLNILRRPREIKIFQDYMLAQGQRYEQAHITQLYVKAPNNVVRHYRGPNTSVGHGLGAAGALGVTGVAAAGLSTTVDAFHNLGAGLDRLAAAQSNSTGWSVWMDYGASPVSIISSIDEKRATLLIQEIHRLLFIEF
jgi:hypothetical protein